MENPEDTNKVLESNLKLRKFTHMTVIKMYIDRDLTVKEREVEFQLKKRANQEKQVSKIVQVKYLKLIIDNMEWNLMKKEERLSGRVKLKGKVVSQNVSKYRLSIDKSLRL